MGKKQGKNRKVDTKVFDHLKKAMENSEGFYVTTNDAVVTDIGKHVEESVDKLLTLALSCEEIKSIYIPDRTYHFIHLEENYIEGEFVLPEGTIVADCSHNKIKHLILPEGVVNVCCENNKIEKLHLPASVQFVSCDNIELTSDRDINDIKVEMNCADGDEDFIDDGGEVDVDVRLIGDMLMGTIANMNTFGSVRDMNPALYVHELERSKERTGT